MENKNEMERRLSVGLCYGDPKLNFTIGQTTGFSVSIEIRISNFNRKNKSICMA